MVMVVIGSCFGVAPGKSIDLSWFDVDWGPHSFVHVICYRFLLIPA